MIGSFGRPQLGRPGWRIAAIVSILIALVSQAGADAGTAAPATTAVGEGAVGASTAAGARPNLIVITIDSLRGDRLFPPADGQHVMPKLEALAEKAVRFDRSYAASPSTAPSNASLLTGLDPVHHGVRHDMDGDGARLADGVVTLADRLRQGGYETLAVVGTDRLGSDTRLNRGFDRYDDDIPGIRKMMAGLSKERRASDVVDRAMRLLDGRTEGKPLFLFLNFHDPHADYEAPDPFKAEYKDDAYGGELASLDPQLAGLVDRLREKKLLDRSILVIAGSHGEAMGEHQEIGHGIYLYETTIRVPLLILAAGVPGAEGRAARVATPVSLTDVAPTLLDLAGVDAAPSKPFDGVSFASLLAPAEGKGRSGAAKAGSGATRAGVPPRAGRPIGIESVQPLQAYGWSPLWALIDGDHKVVQGTFAESFDLAADPKEEHPLKDPAPKWTKKLLAQGQGRLGGFDPPEAKKQEILKAVEAFGVPWADAPFCVAKDSWPDPRLPDKVAVNGTMFTAGLDQAIGAVGRSTRNASQVLETDPDNFSALDWIGFLGIRNRWGDAILDNLELLQCRYPFRINAYHYLAHYYEQKQDQDRALKVMDLMELVDPLSEDTDFDRAVILAHQGKTDEALDHLEKAIRLGANDFTEMKHDSRLGVLARNPRFRAMIGLEPLPPPAPPAASSPASGSK
ncbi:MAG TPA: sulfatase-like hydrolase/transferase [Verrucomicrobiae bacterium]|nr:sulfatase-like hydrolase/transferase [Verrucomicrobiae bacterium]